MKKLLFIFLIYLIGWQIKAQPTWTNTSTGLTSTYDGYISEIDVVNEQIAWAHAISINNGQPVSSRDIAKTTDGGQTWTALQNISLPGAVYPSISNICGIDGNTAYVAAYKTVNGQGVWKTTDGGATWVKISTSSMYNDNASFPNFVYFWDADHGMIQGDPVQGEFEIYTTDDGGQTWQQVAGANIPNPEAADDYGVVAGFETAGSILWFKTRYGNLYKTTDMGHTWTKYNTPLTGTPPTSNDSNFPEFTFKDELEGWILKYDNAALYHTTDGGTTWTQMNPTGSYFKSEISVIPGSDIIVTCGSSQNNFGSAYSTDGGASWVQIDQESHVSLGFYNNISGYSGRYVSANNDRTIWKWVPDPSAVEEQTIAGLKTFPNPSTGKVYVTTSKTKIVAISIFDITGKEVLSLNNLSDYRVSINTSKFDSGMYLLKVIDNSNTQQTIRLIVK